jgi:energy-coupling factor transporter ATP-binding protein EcfA2
MSTLIEGKDLAYTYPGKNKKVIDHINFQIEKGEFLAISGPNDGGKSTLCRLLTGVIPHSLGGTVWGSLSHGGIDIFNASLADLIPHMGIVLDDPDSQLFTQSVDDEICFALENLCRPPEEIEKALTWVKKITAIEDLGERKPTELSGGQKQKVVIAAALAPRPQVLILDEPCSQLDPKYTRDIFCLLQKLKEEYGITIILVSHNSPMIAQFADRLMIMEEGKIAANGKPQEIFSDPPLMERFSLAAVEDCTIVTEPAKETKQTPLLKIENLSFTYPSGTRALTNINMIINRGDYLALIGHNGSGKSTLLGCLLNILKPQEGQITLLNRPLKDYHLADLAPLIGYVQQNPDRQLFSYTLREEAGFGPSNLGISEDELSERVDLALSELELTHLKEEYPPALSRGNRSRTVLASVLTMEPGIFILDEPTGSQDNRGKTLMLELTRALNEKGHTIILVTHNSSHVSQYAKRVIVLEKGSLIEDSLIVKK